MVGIQIPKELSDKVLEAVETAKATGKIRKGSNEVTKVLEKGEAKLVVIAKDTTPPEIVMHLPLIAEEKDAVAVEVESREELGASAGIDIPTAAVAIVDEGDGKKLVASIVEEVKKLK